MLFHPFPKYRCGAYCVQDAVVGAGTAVDKPEVGSAYGPEAEKAGKQIGRLHNGPRASPG